MTHVFRNIEFIGHALAPVVKCCAFVLSINTACAEADLRIGAAVQPPSEKLSISMTNPHTGVITEWTLSTTHQIAGQWDCEPLGIELRRMKNYERKNAVVEKKYCKRIHIGKINYNNVLALVGVPEHVKSESYYPSKKYNISAHISSYDFGVDFSRRKSELIKSTCLENALNEIGLIVLRNKENSPSDLAQRNIPGVMGTCGVRFDGKNKKYARRNSQGDYDLLLSCWEEVQPSVCYAEASYKGWPYSFEFPGELVQHHHKVSIAIEKIFERATEAITTSEQLNLKQLMSE